MAQIAGSDLNGRDYNEVRGLGMSETVPPVDYSWHHYKTTFGAGNDSTVSPLAEQTLADLRELRLTWLDQFDMEISEVGAYRVWNWYDRERSVRWSERRPLSAPLPKCPGLWPSDG